ncbi:PREDICTED: uncharacterized protein C11orf57-like isoform X2 [Priapulus caudatus]|uniref:Uncharacterized protein C11orf57-like isoform X2 n=1 Tax=Priapulus caudatus TaxID=37621 RepID=A0ABM1EJT8_PRICU|nr:PREDICTED: uncharacterized protein C11orf57-like isoform X2 [Priapulus caudatus]
MVGAEMLSQDSKLLLRNIVRHTETHNRITEEQEMWRQLKAEKREAKARKRKHASKDRCRDSRHVSHKSSKHTLGSTSSPSSAESSRDFGKHSNDLYWTQKLMQFEGTNRDRWGHSGYKELYPEEFETRLKNGISPPEEQSKDCQDDHKKGIKRCKRRESFSNDRQHKKHSKSHKNSKKCKSSKKSKTKTKGTKKAKVLKSHDRKHNKT